MKRSIYTLLFLIVSICGVGQSFDSFIQDVEQNNSRLIALQKWLEAEETKVKTGIYPDNPEVSYYYLFGNSNSIGDQQEFEITQSFKMPGFYSSKADVQKLGFQQKQALANKEKRKVLHSAREAFFKLVWLQKKEAILKDRKDDAQILVDLMKEGFEAGEVSKPVYDKARIYSINIQTEWQKVQSQMTIQNQYIQQLNGGNSIEGLVFEYPLDWEIPVLDSLLSNLSVKNPDLVMAQLDIAQSEKEVKNQRMNSLPSFEAGYKSETIFDQKLQGFKAGISIPLWQNNNTVKYARLNTETLKANFSYQESELITIVSTLYFEAKVLKENYEQMKLIMDEEEVSESSLQLLQSGQISFSEYLVEIGMITESALTYFQYELDYYTSLSTIKVYSE
jgi:outer membrane protein TolC